MSRTGSETGQRVGERGDIETDDTLPQRYRECPETRPRAGARDARAVFEALPGPVRATHEGAPITGEKLAWGVAVQRDRQVPAAVHLGPDATTDPYEDGLLRKRSGREKEKARPPSGMSASAAIGNQGSGAPLIGLRPLCGCAHPQQSRPDCAAGAGSPDGATESPRKRPPIPRRRGSPALPG